MEVKIESNGIYRAAEELTECSKRLKRLSADLYSTARRGELEPGKRHELSKAEKLFEQRSRTLETMADVLFRTSDTAENAEEAILEHEALMKAGRKDAVMMDLAEITKAVKEVMK